MPHLRSQCTERCQAAATRATSPAARLLLADTFMKLHYRLVEQDGGYLASCHEVEVAASGGSAAEAVEALLSAVREALYSDEAVAPPSRAPAAEVIDLVLFEPRTASEDGPGDLPPPVGALRL